MPLQNDNKRISDEKKKPLHAPTTDNKAKRREETTILESKQVLNSTFALFQLYSHINNNKSQL